MSLIADEEDYENSDAEQVAMLSWSYGYLYRLKDRRCNLASCSCIIVLCVFACVTEVHVIRELSEMFMVATDNFI